MNAARHFRVALQVTALCSALPAAICFANAQRSSISAQESLKNFLQHWDRDKTTRYVAAFTDLNDDGKPEAIVYLMGGWCGSGGCTTLIIVPAGDSWRIVTKIPITQLPVRVLESGSNGWHDIGVWVQGGGIQPGYEAELRFNGKSYPRNPSVPPARRLEGKTAAGEVVISSTRGAILLHDK